MDGRSEYFTFHNVSIKSKARWMNGRARTAFTFHNVSIKSGGSFLFVLEKKNFTFHNVSIKSSHISISLFM